MSWEPKHMSREERRTTIAAARRDCKKRGCTCGTRARGTSIEYNGETDQWKVMIVHLHGCPLWNDPTTVTPETPPNSVIEVELP